MPYSLEDKLVVAVSSRALFNFSDANRIFEAEGEALYRRYQKEHLEEVAEPGVAFPLVQKLLRFNGPSLEERRVEVVVLSKKRCRQRIAGLSLGAGTWIGHHSGGIYGRAAQCLVSDAVPGRFISVGECGRRSRCTGKRVSRGDRVQQAADPPAGVCRRTADRVRRRRRAVR